MDERLGGGGDEGMKERVRESMKEYKGRWR